MQSLYLRVQGLTMELEMLYYDTLKTHKAYPMLTIHIIMQK